MKKFNLLLIALFLCLTSFSQITIENPKVGFTTFGNGHINKIELWDTATIFYFHTYATPNTWISIPKMTYIQVPGDSLKLYIVKTEGIPLNEKYFMPESGEVDYQLYFPKIDPATSMLDYGEDNDGGSWFSYDIQLKPVLTHSPIPTTLSGDWYNTKSGNWEISFLDSLAVYDKQVWSYGAISLKKGKGSIRLKNNSGSIELFVQEGKNGNYLMGRSPESYTAMARQSDYKNVVSSENDKAFELPLFRYDSATYSGYIKGYNPRMKMGTGILYINDILTGDQNSVVFKVSDKGTFSVTFPLYYPHEVYVRTTLYSGTVFFEPGKEVFQMIDPSKKGKSFFMGESARLNSELFRLMKLRSFDYEVGLTKILEFNATEYKDYCLGLMQKDLDSLDAHRAKYHLSDRAYQVKKLSIEYEYPEILMSYKGNYEYAYRMKNKIPNTQRTSPVKAEPLPSDYFNFLTNDLVNNTIGVLATGYGSFINRLMFLDVLRGKSTGISALELMEAVRQTGHQFTPEEEKYFEASKKLEEKGYKELMNAFYNQFGTRINDLNTKYKEQIAEFRKSMNGQPQTMAMTSIYLKDKGVSFTEDEKELIELVKSFETSEASLKMKEFSIQYGAMANKFYTEYNSFITKFYVKSRTMQRNDLMKDRLGLQPGFATDIMTAQDECRYIVSELTPVSESELAGIKQRISDPFIAEFVGKCNEETLAKIEANKSKKGSNINSVPETEGEKVFAEIIKKYQGKVIYVDFWATWCGPCRSGIEQIKPLKEEMINENVVFVYITNPSSPLQTYNNMIPDIKGEHYRLTQDEWNIISGQFNISGIPHYALVGKNGEIINPHLGHLSNEQLKSLLKKHISE